MERRRRRIRRGQTAEPGPPAEDLPVDDLPAEDISADDLPADATPRSPSPHDLAELGSTFALTSAVHDPDAEPRFSSSDEAVDVDPTPVDHHVDVHTERGLRGLVGGGSSQVSVTAAMRARDAARPTDEDIAAAESDLLIVRRGWVPREDLPRGGRR
jgi:hypothetical protein